MCSANLDLFHSYCGDSTWEREEKPGDGGGDEEREKKRI